MKRCKKLIAFVCIFAMLFSMVGYTDAPPAKGSDITGHWAAKDLAEWLAKGYITADAAGLVNPNSVITRAEFANYVNKAFKFTEKATISFTDVKSTDIFADDIAKAVKAGYMVGSGDGTWKPNATITRQEVTVLLARLLGLDDTSNGLAFAGFADKAKVAAWATNSVIAVSAKGYMAGDGKNFNPLSNMTRAEAVTLLTRADGDYYAFIIKTPGIVNTPKLDGSVYVKANNVEMKGTEITGNLVIGKEVGDGNFTLRDSVVKGNIVINGGGVNSIHLINVVTGNVIVQRANGNVRVSLEGTSNISSLSVLTPASLQVAAQSRITALVLNSPAAITGAGTIASTAINTTGVTSTITLPNVTGSVGSKGVITPPTSTPPAAPVVGGSGGGSSSGGNSGGGTSNLGTISISAENRNVVMGYNTLPKITVNPADATLTFTSLNPEIATVNSSTGRITGIAKGTATIRVDAVKSRYTSNSATFTVSVDLLGWQYYYDRIVGFRPFNITDATSITIQQSEDNGKTWGDSVVNEDDKYEVVELTPNTEYSFRLKIEGGKYAGYSNIITITTESNLREFYVIDYNQTSATFKFTPLTDATKVSLRYGQTNADYTKYPEQVLTALDYKAGKATINGLKPGTEYNFYLLVEGGIYAGMSNWTSIETASNDILIDTHFPGFYPINHEYSGYINNNEAKLLFKGTDGKPYIPAAGSKVEYITWDDGNQATWTPVLTLADKPYVVINGLRSNTNYQFRLVVPAGVDKGTSKRFNRTTQGNVQDLTWADIRSTNEAKFTLTPTGTDDVEIIFEEFDGNDYISADYATISPINSTTNEITITGLKSGTQYWIQLYVIDGENAGWSNGIDFSTAPKDIINVNVVNQDGRNFKITWTPDITETFLYQKIYLLPAGTTLNLDQHQPRWFSEDRNFKAFVLETENPDYPEASLDSNGDPIVNGNYTIYIVQSTYWWDTIASASITVGTAPVVPVTSITVSGAGGATTVINGGTLQMMAAVDPVNATDQTLIWSITNGTGAALIDASTGFLQAKGVGTVTVTATNAVSGVTGTKEITIMAATPSVYSFTAELANSVVSVVYGTYEADAIAALDLTVNVFGTLNETGTATISWTISDYNELVAGDYDAEGVLTLPAGWIGTPAVVTAKIRVEP